MNIKVFLLLLFLIAPISIINAEEKFLKIYPDEGEGGLTSEGRVFEDRYDDWFQTIDKDIARIGRSDIDIIHSLRNSIGNAFGSHYYSNTRLFYSFDTESVPEGAEIKSAKLFLYAFDDDVSHGEEKTLYLVEGTPSDPGSITASDYSEVGDLVLGSTNSEWIVNQWNYVELNLEGLAFVSQHQIPTFALRGWYDLNRSVPNSQNEIDVAIVAMEYPGTDKDPYLEITYTVPDDEKSIEELLEELRQAIINANFANNLENSYFAHVLSNKGVLNHTNNKSLLNQLEALEKKLYGDAAKGFILPEEFLEIYDILSELIEKVEIELAEAEEDKNKSVPLLTQVKSPHPSIEETTLWSESLYAGGRASSTGDCGLTIRQCGCAITSLSMIGKYHGVESGFDDTEVNPLNMNNWLLENDGYTKYGAVLWTYAFAYLGEQEDELVKSHISFKKNGLGVTDKKAIQQSVQSGNPALGFNPNRFHWMVLKGNTDNGFEINDPASYNTQTTNDTASATLKVYDYNDNISKSHLIEYSEKLETMPVSVELVLESPAEILITDENGSQCGFDESINDTVCNIDGGWYDNEDVIGDPENPSNTPHYRKRLMLIEPESGAFAIDVIGTGDGSYNLTHAISEGGVLERGEVSDEISDGLVHGYTVVINAEEDVLPNYLTDILALIPEEEQKKFYQAFKVVFAQTEKGHIAVTETLIANLVKYIENVHGEETWSEGVVDALNAL